MKGEPEIGSGSPYFPSTTQRILRTPLPSPALIASLAHSHCLFSFPEVPAVTHVDDPLLPLFLPVSTREQRSALQAPLVTPVLETLLLAAQPAALFLLDSAGVIQHVGGAWERVTEYAAEEVIGRTLASILRLPAAGPDGLLDGSGQSTDARLLTRTGVQAVTVSWQQQGEHIAGHLERCRPGQVRARGGRDLDQAVYCLGVALDGGQGQHVDRMVSLASRLAGAICLPDEQLREVRWGAALHDVGKSRVPQDILGKNGPLTPEEFEVIRHHPAWGLEIVQALEFLTEPVRTAVLHHHERYDGQGYPYGLKGEAIPLSARIVAIADVFDALTSARSYKPAWSPQDATSHLIAGAGTQFDPWLVRVFVLDVLGFTAFTEQLNGAAFL